MPIIKDKYRAKGTQSRSKYITRSGGESLALPQDNLNTQQLQAIKTKQIRELEQPTILSKIDSTPVIDNKKEIIGITLNTVNSLQEITTINTGEYLSNILVGGIVSGSSTTIISLYWSYYSLDSITVSIAEGIINTSKGSAITRIFSYNLNSNATINLGGDNELKDFGNFSKDVYIYGLTNLAGQDFTIIKKTIG
jgi:hypothetical protein